MHNFNSISFLTVAVAQAADNVMEALRSMRQGMRSTTRKRAREEMSGLFNTKKDKREKPVWQHRFFCLAFRDQERVPTTEFLKEELHRAGLGEQIVKFHTLNMCQKEFKDHLIGYFPQLANCGGFQLLKGM